MRSWNVNGAARTLLSRTTQPHRRFPFCPVSPCSPYSARTATAACIEEPQVLPPSFTPNTRTESSPSCARGPLCVRARAPSPCSPPPPEKKKEGATHLLHAFRTPPSWSHCVSRPEMYSSCQSDAPLPGLTPLNRFSPCRTGFVRVSPIAASMARRELSFSYRILSCNPAMLHKLWPRTTSAAGNVSKLALDTQLIRLPLSTSIDRR